MYYYESYRYHIPCKQVCVDLAEAIGCAWADMKTGEAWPIRIWSLSLGKALWESVGPIKTAANLQAFAKANGVRLDIAL